MLDLSGCFADPALKKNLPPFLTENDQALPFIQREQCLSDYRWFDLNMDEMPAPQRARIFEGWKAHFKISENKTSLPLCEKSIPPGGRIVPLDMWKSFTPVTMKEHEIYYGPGHDTEREDG